MAPTTHDTDLLIVGSGAAGMTAAAVAAAEGLRALVVEKTALVGGTTAISGGMVWIPCQEHLRAGDSVEAARRYLDAGYLTRADTLVGLAARLGIDAGELADTVAAYNEAARTGVDLEFGRGADAYSRYLGDADVGPNPCLAALATPPFFAIALVPSDLGTAAGLTTDPHARVLGAHGAPVPGLYAAGGDMRSIMCGRYPGPGITLGPALTFGYLAAMHAAGAASDDPATSR